MIAIIANAFLKSSILISVLISSLTDSVTSGVIVSSSKLSKFSQSAINFLIPLTSLESSLKVNIINFSPFLLLNIWYNHYAKEGTLAHELSELKLRRELNLIGKEAYDTEVSKLDYQLLN